MDITSRFKGAEALPLLQSLPIGCVGNGGIGSNFLYSITKAGPKEVFNWEYDTVEQHNLGGQLFTVHQIGCGKAEATEKNCKRFNSYTDFKQLGKFTPNSGTLPIMFMCVDNNEIRKVALEAWRENAEAHDWIHEFELDGVNYRMPFVMIDGRLSFDKMNIFTITKNTYNFHVAEKLPEKVATEADCTTKSNPHVGPVCANLMVSTYFNYLQNCIDYCTLGVTARNVPYLLELDFNNGICNHQNLNETSIWNY